MAHSPHTPYDPSAQASLEPITPQAHDGLQGVHENWRHAVRLYRPCAGLCIQHIHGRPGGKWAFPSEGPAAFSLNILLEGRMQAAFHDGAVLDAGAGSAILMASGQTTAGWNVLDSQSEGGFRLVGIHLPQAAMASLTGLDMDDLRARARGLGGEQSHIDAFLGVVPASSRLRRVVSELPGLGGCSSRVLRNLYLRAKALEAIACFVHEHLEPKDIPLSAPADRARLHAARALLEQRYDRAWTVQTLAHAVGLNEKRLQSGFRALYGDSVHTCLTRIRLDAAIVLLRRGTSVTEPAVSCGFGNLSHFSRLFRSRVGISPKQCAMGQSGMARLDDRRSGS